VCVCVCVCVGGMGPCDSQLLEMEWRCQSHQIKSNQILFIYVPFVWRLHDSMTA
jgi:hypothetical protein